MVHVLRAPRPRVRVAQQAAVHSPGTLPLLVHCFSSEGMPPPHGLLNLMLTSLISETVAVIVHQALFIFVYLRNKKLPLFFFVRLALVYV